jgi:hypothetical protein
MQYPDRQEPELEDEDEGLDADDIEDEDQTSGAPWDGSSGLHLTKTLPPQVPPSNVLGAAQITSPP